MIGSTKNRTEIIRENAFEHKKKKPGLNLTPGYALISLQTTGPCWIVIYPMDLSNVWTTGSWLVTGQQIELRHFTVYRDIWNKPWTAAKYESCLFYHYYPFKLHTNIHNMNYYRQKNVLRRHSTWNLLTIFLLKSLKKRRWFLTPKVFLVNNMVSTDQECSSMKMCAPWRHK